MRKQTNLLLLSFLFFAIHSRAQVDKGGIYPGLITGIEFNSTGLRLVPSLNIGLDKHNTIGVFYSRIKHNNSHLNGFSGYSLFKGAGISFNHFHYFKNSTKWGWYANGTLGYYRWNNHSTFNGLPVGEPSYNQQEFSLTPGLFFKPYKNIMLFTNIGGLSFVRNKYEFNTHLNFTNEVNIGVLINLRGFKKRHK